MVIHRENVWQKIATTNSGQCWNTDCYRCGQQGYIVALQKVCFKLFLPKYLQPSYIFVHKNFSKREVAGHTIHLIPINRSPISSFSVSENTCSCYWSWTCCQIFLCLKGTQTRQKGRFKAELTLSPYLHVEPLITAIRAIAKSQYM